MILLFCWMQVGAQWMRPLTIEDGGTRMTLADSMARASGQYSRKDFADGMSAGSA